MFIRLFLTRLQSFTYLLGQLPYENESLRRRGDEMIKVLGEAHASGYLPTERPR